MSIVFDRAVEYYDQTRALPEWRHNAMIESLIRESGMKPEDHVLEIGIGTGRIAFSVALHVNRLYGIDLSQEMMGMLRRKLADAKAVIELSQADAVRLPFPNETFEVAYAVHVYHLVHQWRSGIAEAWRILKPGGHFVVSFHKRDANSPNVLLRNKMHSLANELGVDTKRPGAQSEQEIYEEIVKFDPAPRVVIASEWQDVEVPARILEELDRQIFSETWMIPREVMDKIMPPLREWANVEYGDVTKPIENTYESRWLVAQKK